FLCQAEDGIRDFHVTGVQTCALPISTADAEGQKAHAHKLKGSCYAIGARTMAELCARIEAGEADAPALVEELQGELEIVVAALEIGRASCRERGCGGGGAGGGTSGRR